MSANFNLGIIAEFVSGVSADPDDFTMLRSAVLFDAFARANGAAGGTCTVQKGATAITDPMNVGAGAGTLARATTLDDAVNSFVPGDVLRVVKSSAVSSSTSIYLAAAGVTA